MSQMQGRNLIVIIYFSFKCIYALMWAEHMRMCGLGVDDVPVLVCKGMICKAGIIFFCQLDI